MLKKIRTWRVRAVILFLFRLTARDSSSKVAYKEVRGREGLVCHQGRKKALERAAAAAAADKTISFRIFNLVASDADT